MNNISQILYAHRYNEHAQRIAHRIKDFDIEAMREAAHDMAMLIDSSYIVVPAPSHFGYATDTVCLANMIRQICGADVADVLKSYPRASQYYAKLNGSPLNISDMNIHSNISLHGKIAIVDNVVDTGTTALACANALRCSTILSYAMTNNFIYG